MGIASFAQGSRDSLVQIPVSDYLIFTECCINESQLEKDTATLNKNISDYKLSISDYRQQLFNNSQIIRDQTSQISLTKNQLTLTEKNLKTETKLKLVYRNMVIIFTPIALIGGILLGHILK